jgi:hypothetical protein
MAPQAAIGLNPSTIIQASVVHIVRPSARVSDGGRCRLSGISVLALAQGWLRQFNPLLLI